VSASIWRGVGAGHDGQGMCRSPAGQARRPTPRRSAVRASSESTEPGVHGGRAPHPAGGAPCLHPGPFFFRSLK